MLRFFGKMINFNPKNTIYLLISLFDWLLWNKLAKNVPICLLKNSIKLFMIKTLSWITVMDKSRIITIKLSQYHMFFLWISFRINRFSHKCKFEWKIMKKLILLDALSNHGGSDWFWAGTNGLEVNICN